MQTQFRGHMRYICLLALVLFSAATCAQQSLGDVARDARKHKSPQTPAKVFDDDSFAVASQCKGGRVLVMVRSHSQDGAPVADFQVTDLAGGNVGQALSRGAAVPPSDTWCGKVADPPPGSPRQISPDESQTRFDPPQVVELCNPREQPYIVSITGTQRGLFDLEIKSDYPGEPGTSPVLLCNYFSDAGTRYDWMFRFELVTRPTVKRAMPTVFFLGPKDNPAVQKELQSLSAREPG